MKYPKSKSSSSVRNRSSQYNYSKPSSPASPKRHILVKMSEEATLSLSPSNETGLTFYEEIRLANRITTCSVCSRTFKEPVTLSCGNTVCHDCLPRFDPHTVWKFECPILDCKRKSHLFGDIRSDVSIQKISDLVQKEVEIYRRSCPQISVPPSLKFHSDSDSETESIADNEESRDLTFSPSMAFLESDLWSDVESNPASPLPHSPGANNYDDNDSDNVTSTAEPLDTPSPVPLPVPSQTKESPDGSFMDRLLSELECQICCLLFYEPITTPCGHTFCKGCILRSIDHTDKCPLCRHILPGYSFFNNHPVNYVLNGLISNLFIELSKERQLVAESDLSMSKEEIPLFVCSLIFPKIPLFLHIFEPRYRLMLRRRMESGSPRFGMVLPGKSGEEFKEYGTMVEIANCTLLADGGSMVEAIGTYRFRVIKRDMRDGYHTGFIERIDDIPPEEEDELERADLALNDLLRAQAISQTNENNMGKEVEAGTEIEQKDREEDEESNDNGKKTFDETQEAEDNTDEQSEVSSPAFSEYSVEMESATQDTSSQPQYKTSELVAQARLFVEQLKHTSTPWFMQRISSTGDMPEDNNEFSWWVASILPIDEHERYRLLAVTSTRQRMKTIMEWIAQLREQWWYSRGGCTLM